MRTKASLNATQHLTVNLADELADALQQNDAQLRKRIDKLQQRLQAASTGIQPASDREAALYAKNALLSLMSAAVRVEPSQHEFFITGQDSILEAGLKAGLNLEYGCTSGNCGKCKIRVRDGQIKRIREYDYILSATEAQQGYALACSNTAVSDLVIEAREAIKPEDLPQQKVRAAVKKQITMGDYVLLDVQTPRTSTLRFMAGQQVSLTTDSGQQLELPVASCPCDSRNLQFLLPLPKATAFIDSLAQYDQATVRIEGPFGDFVLEDESSAPAVFVSVDNGIAYMKSLIEHAISIDNAVSLHLFRLDNLPHGSRISNLLRSWDDALDNFSYARLDEKMSPQQTLQEIDMRFPGLKDCQLYVAAPPAWLEDFRKQLAKNDMAPAAMHWQALPD
jgi:CDP-4-dehydro-6-deoxyglucose reductase